MTTTACPGRSGVTAYVSRGPPVSVEARQEPLPEALTIVGGRSVFGIVYADHASGTLVPRLVPLG